MAAPGTLANHLPPGPDFINRKLADLERGLREGLASVAQSFQSTVASLIVAESSSNSAAGLATPTTSTAETSVTFTVPTGYTEAIVTATATAMALNNTTATDYLYAEVIINGVQGGELYAAAGPGLAAGTNAPYYTTLTGLTAGDTITVSASVRTGLADWGASPSNTTNIYAQVLFLRGQTS